jgi:hypothetical protein
MLPVKNRRDMPSKIARFAIYVIFYKRENKI